jgi:hypothetical protein
MATPSKPAQKTARAVEGPRAGAVRRAFMASGAEVLNSTDIYDWAHGRNGGAHVCAPKQEDVNRGVLFCVVLPPDG